MSLPTLGGNESSTCPNCESRRNIEIDKINKRMKVSGRINSQGKEPYKEYWFALDKGTDDLHLRIRISQGDFNTHAEAKAAAEKFADKHGFEIDWTEA